MPWFVTFCYLTMPFVIGVACTLAVPAHDPRYEPARGLFAALVWYIVAYKVHRYLRLEKPHNWTRWWTCLLVLLPIILCYLVAYQRSHVRDPGSFHSEASSQTPLPPAALTPFFPTWRDTIGFAARMQPHPLQFLFQLFVSLPPTWWFIALVLAVVLGRRKWNS
jgi:hypothetical protein